MSTVSVSIMIAGLAAGGALMFVGVITGALLAIKSRDEEVRLFGRAPVEEAGELQEFAGVSVTDTGGQLPEE